MISPPRHQDTKGNREKMNRGKCQKGFTLIEILVVIVILTILAGIVVGAAKYAMTKAARSRAQAEIATMENALENYKSDNGVYPITAAGRPTTGNPLGYANSYVLYTALVGGPGQPKTYMTFKPNQIQAVSLTQTNILDPFGHLYSYYCTQPLQNDQVNTTSFDLWSYGPSGTNGDPSMITNWKQ